MIVIYAEKPDVGNKIAAALDKITLSSGKTVTFSNLKTEEKAVKSQQFKDGFLKIKYLGDDCYVTWGYGHLCELKAAVDYDPDYKNWAKMPMPFIPDKYEVKVKDEVKKQFNLVRDLMKKASLIINATDYDREGELIFSYLYEAARLKVPFKRAHFSSQTEEGLKDGFKTLLSEKDVEPITNAGRGRSIADAVVGWNMTAKMTLKAQTHEVLSIGRVQTPTLNILVERELAIRNFVPEPYYTINAEFTTSSSETYKAEHVNKKFKTNAEAKAVFDKINGKDGTVTNIEEKITKKEAPNLYSLSSLQMAANSKYGFTMAKTLEVAQQLYEAGYTTYPRTDSQYLTEDMVPVVNEVLDILAKNSPIYNGFIDGKGKVTKTKKYFDDSKVQSHFAIIPTKVYPKSFATTDQEKLYDLIARSVIMMLYKEAEILNTKVITTVEDEDFVSNGKVVKDAQWMTVDTVSKDELLPKLAKGQKVTGEYKLNEKMTEPPKRFTDKTLLSAMLNAGKEIDDEALKKAMAALDVHGIGTEATRAAIIETLVTRKYVERDKKSIYPTERGIQLIKILPIEEIKSAELTAKWEQRLNDIALGKESLPHFVADIENITRKWVKELDEKIEEGSVSTREAVGTCPVCGKDILKMKWGYGCSGYKEGCKFTIPAEIAGKKLTEKNVISILEKGCTPVIKGFKSKSGKTFDASLKIEEGKVAFDFGTPTPKAEPTATSIVCPKCGKTLMNTTWAYKCDDCEFSISKKIASRELSEEEVKKLLTDGKTDVLNGFVSKAGKKFNAALKLDEENKVVFDFDASASASSTPKTSSFECPDCKKPLEDTPWAYKCDCGLNISKKIAGKDLSESQIKKILSKGKSDKISGFVSKAGKKFDAVLALEDKKIVFKFD